MNMFVFQDFILKFKNSHKIRLRITGKMQITEFLQS